MKYLLVYRPGERIPFLMVMCEHIAFQNEGMDIVYHTTGGVYVVGEDWSRYEIIDPITEEVVNRIHDCVINISRP